MLRYIQFKGTGAERAALEQKIISYVGCIRQRMFRWKRIPIMGILADIGASLLVHPFLHTDDVQNILLTGASARKDGHYERKEAHSGSQWHKG